MVSIKLHPQFTKSYDKRIKGNPRLVKKVTERIELFQNDPINPLLRDHALAGKKHSYRAFWITGNIRIVYFPMLKNSAVFLDIGSHNQVY